MTGGTVYATGSGGRGGGERGGWLTLALSLLLVLLCLSCGAICGVCGRCAGVGMTVPSTVGCAVGGVVGLLSMGWSGLLRVDCRVVPDALRLGRWPLLVAASFMCLNAIVLAASGSVPSPGWPLRTCGVAALCLITGVAEESMFRGLLLGGLLAVLGRGRRGRVASAALSALVFGLLHVDWPYVDLTDAALAAQAVLKTAQTGLLGFYLASVAMSTGGVTCPALVHGASNFLLMACSFGLMGMPMELEYVSTGDTATATLVLYAVVTALYVPLARAGTRLVTRQLGPDKEI